MEKEKRAGLPVFAEQALEQSLARVSLVESTSSQPALPSDLVRVLSPGEELDGKYRVLSFIGAGGYAEVYEAEHLLLHRKVALKILNDSQKDSMSVAKLRREATVCSQLQHPGIAAIYDMGVHKEMPFVAMELVSGVSLQSAVKKEGPFSYERVRNILAQCLEALKHAHLAGAVHRDITPSNIMLCKGNDGSERVKIIDFGIARMKEQNVGVTKTGAIVGNPSYMSPEQCAGHPTDARSDLYSLACSAYFALTGKPVFESDTLVGLLYKHTNEPIPQLPENLLSEDNVLAWVISTALRKSPADRFQSADEMLDVLFNVMPVVPSAPIIRGSRTRSKSTAAKRGIAIIAAIVMGIIVPYTIGFFFGRQTSHIPTALADVSSHLAKIQDRALAVEIDRRIKEQSQLVKDSDGRGVVVGRIRFEGLRPARLAAPVVPLSGGYFVLGVKNYTTPLGFAAAGYNPVFFDLDKLNLHGDVVWIGDMLMTKTKSSDMGTIGGQVVDPSSGKPTAANIELDIARFIEGLDGNHVPQTMIFDWPETRKLTTDQAGRFSFEKLSPGFYNIHVIADGRETISLPLELKPGEKLNAGLIQIPKQRLVEIEYIRTNQPDITHKVRGLTGTKIALASGGSIVFANAGQQLKIDQTSTQILYKPIGLGSPKSLLEHMKFDEETSAFTLNGDEEPLQQNYVYLIRDPGGGYTNHFLLLRVRIVEEAKKG